MDDLIFTPSVPQSGTWFTLRFFERLGYQIAHTGQIMQGDSIPEGKVVLNTHIFPFYFQPEEYKQYWPSYGGDRIQEYVVRKDKMCIGSIKLLASLYKTVIPVRDPLASILTREARAPQLRHFCVVDGYVELVRELAGNKNVMFLPVDLNMNEFERKHLLTKIAKHCGIELNQKNRKEIAMTAYHWQKQNITPNNRFHKPYDKGDIEQIKEWLGEKWAEVVYLKNMGGLLIPFLSKLGYNQYRTLIW